MNELNRKGGYVMRQPLVVANWKMNMTSPEADVYCQRLLSLMQATTTSAEVVVCPPFTAIETVRCAFAGSDTSVGAQNFYPVPKGAYTGEISISMLKALACRYVIIGHSERRLHFGETAETIGEKVKVAVANGLTPILCVGETMSERSLGMTEKVIGQQLLTCLKHLQSDQLAQVVVAYEPLWAIGTGRSATAKDAAQLAKYARQRLQRLMNGDTDAMRILYGGSVTPENIDEFAAAEGVDGVLVGGASLDPDKFMALVQAYEVK